jgi:hypothetical protein
MSSAVSIKRSTRKISTDATKTLNRPVTSLWVKMRSTSIPSGAHFATPSTVPASELLDTELQVFRPAPATLAQSEAPTDEAAPHRPPVLKLRSHVSRP